MIRKRVIALIAAAALVALGGCTPGDDPGTDPSATPTITVWVDETRQGPVRVAAAAFEDATGVKVELVLKNWNDLRPDFVTQAPTGEGPDIVVGAHDWLGDLLANGVIAPLELSDQAANFNPISIQAFASEGQIYGLPYAVENIALIRNADLVPTAAAATWDATVAAGRAANTRYPIVVQVGEGGDGYTLYPLQTSFGAPVFAQNEDGSYTPEVAMGGENGRNFARWLAEQGKAGLLTQDITYDIAVAAFAAGESPYIIGGPWMLAQFEDVNVAIDPLPAAGTHPARPFVGVQGFYLSAQSKNALAATDFLVNYLASEDVQYSLYETGGRPPALTAAAERASSDPIIAGFAEVGRNAVPMPSIPEMGAVWSFWGVTEASIIAGTQDAVAAWDKMVADIEAEIA